MLGSGVAGWVSGWLVVTVGHCWSLVVAGGHWWSLVVTVDHWWLQFAKQSCTKKKQREKMRYPDC